jgi:pyruvate formate lyase activating enzyme
MVPIDPANVYPARYGKTLADGRVRCELCPRLCRIQPGQRGLCFVRANFEGALVLTTYGRSSGFCVDPIEKKPLNHFLPGTPVLSFGTAGCNLTCTFCQNWTISKSRQMDTLADVASPAAIAEAAVRVGARSVAFTYNDPVIFLEYAVDTAAACRARGIKTVAVTAGYISATARPEFFAAMDAVNVDLKAWTEGFYQTLCTGALEPVLDTLRYIKRETTCWLEITCLLIPGQNDDPAELAAMSAWLVEHLGPDVPLHFSAFHPAFRLKHVPPTPSAALQRARGIAQAAGLNHVYTGNVHDRAGDTTRCSACDAVLIERDWYQLLGWRLDAAGCCAACGAAVPGVFEAQPGAWGRRRLPVRISG